MLKPCVINRRLVGEVIERLEKKGFKLVGLKMMHVSEDLAGKHYAEHDGKPFYNDLVNYVTSGPVIAMVWQADDCVTLMRKVVGATKPTEAIPGTIRGDYCIHTDRNIIHASDSDESAEREINLWFKPEELYDWADCEDGWYQPIIAEPLKNGLRQRVVLGSTKERLRAKAVPERLLKVIR